MTRHRPGDVLFLERPTGDVPPGLYGLLSLVDARASICAAERFKDGQIRVAGRIHRIHVYTLNTCFDPTGERLADAPPIEARVSAWRN